MTDMVKEAIADAKQLREGAIENAKAMLQEKFMPKLEAMIEESLMQEDDDEDLDLELEEKDIEIDISDNTEDDDMDLDESLEDDEDLELESLLRELEEEDDMDEEIEESKMKKSDRKWMKEDCDDDEDEDLEMESLLRELEEDDEDLDLEESDDLDDLDLDDISESDIRDILSSLTEADDEEEPTEEIEDDEDDEFLDDLGLDLDGDDEVDVRFSKDEAKETVYKLKKENKKLKSSLTEAYDAIKLMKDKINEVNLMNSKLLYTNKLFNNPAYDLNESQKMGILETFDKATTLREVKLVYSTFSANLKESKGQTNKSPLKGFASDTVITENKRVKPENNSMINRWQALAGMKDAY